MDIEVKRMSPTTIEMLDQLSAVCKRFVVEVQDPNERLGMSAGMPAASRGQILPMIHREFGKLRIRSWKNLNNRQKSTVCQIGRFSNGRCFVKKAQFVK